MDKTTLLMKRKKQREGGCRDDHNNPKGGEDGWISGGAWGGCDHVHDRNGELLALTTVVWLGTNVPFGSCRFEHNGVVSGGEVLRAQWGNTLVEGSAVHREHVVLCWVVLKYC